MTAWMLEYVRTVESVLLGGGCLCRSHRGKLALFKRCVVEVTVEVMVNGSGGCVGGGFQGGDG